jgi:hypothetical protein
VLVWPGPVPIPRGGKFGRSPSSLFLPRGFEVRADPFLDKFDAPAVAIDLLGGGTDGGVTGFIDKDDLRESDGPSPVTSLLKMLGFFGTGGAGFRIVIDDIDAAEGERLTEPGGSNVRDTA